MSKNSAQKRMSHVKQGRMVIVADLYKRGWSIRKIADEVKARMGTTCSTKTIWNDINDLLKEWQAARIQDTDARLQLELERIDDCVAELWEQWDKSKEDWTREHNKRIGVPVAASDGNGGQDGQQVEIQTVKREHLEENVVGLGNPAYIAEIRQQLAERRKLLGLYAATKSEVTGKDGTPLIPAQQMSEEDIMKEIERIRNSRKG
jgi:hypothetical protein